MFKVFDLLIAIPLLSTLLSTIMGGEITQRSDPSSSDARTPTSARSTRFPLTATSVHAPMHSNGAHDGNEATVPHPLNLQVRAPVTEAATGFAGHAPAPQFVQHPLVSVLLALLVISLIVLVCVVAVFVGLVAVFVKPGRAWLGTRLRNGSAATFLFAQPPHSVAPAPGFLFTQNNAHAPRRTGADGRGRYYEPSAPFGAGPEAGSVSLASLLLDSNRYEPVGPERTLPPRPALDAPHVSGLLVNLQATGTSPRDYPATLFPEYQQNSAFVRPLSCNFAGRAIRVRYITTYNTRTIIVYYIYCTVFEYMKIYIVSTIKWPCV